MRSQFERLIADFTALVNLSDAPHLANGGAFSVDDVAFSLIYNEDAGLDRFFLYADFGMPPADKEKDAYHALLQHNFMQFAGKGPAYTISPFTGHVVYIEHFTLDATTPEALANALASIAGQARDWSHSFFLTGPNTLVIGSTAADLRAALN